MSTHTSFILKVLSGANTGATVRLKTGTIVIGRNMSNDIILHDDNIADQHIQLIATSNGVTLQPLVQPVFVDGSEVGLEGIYYASTYSNITACTTSNQWQNISFSRFRFINTSQSNICHSTS